ncbi:MAG: aspartate aminotransferase family protein [Chloroflexi bacterium]|nr:aspartate aminotransferase family protein [Chloroflexota bacterium]
MTSQWIERASRRYMNTGKRQPITLVRGEGARVWDDQGKEYLDFVAGWGVCCLGHSHPAVLKALEQQSKQLIQVSNQFYSAPQIELAELLAQLSGLEKVFFGNSGAEANEGAVKLARKWGKANRDGAYEVISATLSFHGRTLAMTAATGQEKFHKPFEPMPDGFTSVPFNDIDALKAATSPKTVAVMLEPVQGEGGVNVPDEAYLKDVREWCDKRNLLLILDEVQTGIGRLGSWFGFQQFGVAPDILSLAKGLGGGVPIGAVLCGKRADVFAPGDHGSTFGGNPLACAVALAVLRYIQENGVIPHVRKVGSYLEGELALLKGKYRFAKDVRGRGLLLALAFTSDISDAVIAECNRQGLLLNPVKPNAVRFLPPLTVTRAEVDEAVARLDLALAKVSASVADEPYKK